MSKYLAGPELKNSVAEKFAETIRSFAGQQKQNEPFHDLLVPAKPQIHGRHSAEQKRTEYLADIDGVSANLPDELACTKQISDSPQIDLDMPKSTELVKLDPSEEPIFMTVPSPLESAPIYSRLLPQTYARNESAHENPTPFGLYPEIQFSSPVHGKSAAASKKQSVPSQKNELETPPQKNSPIVQTIDFITSQAKASMEPQNRESLQSSSSIAGGLLSSSTVLPTQTLDLAASGRDLSNTDKMASKIDANVVASRDVTSQLVNDMRMASNSRTLLVHMDLPDMGKITARFGGHADTISMTLTSKDETMALSVAEVQRDMKVWLDHMNLSPVERAQSTGTNPDGSKDYQEGSPNRENKSNYHPSGHSSRTSPLSEGFNDAIWNQPQIHHKSARKWRWI